MAARSTRTVRKSMAIETCPGAVSGVIFRVLLSFFLFALGKSSFLLYYVPLTPSRENVHVPYGYRRLCTSSSTMNSTMPWREKCTCRMALYSVEVNPRVIFSSLSRIVETEIYSVDRRWIWHRIATF